MNKTMQYAMEEAQRTAGLKPAPPIEPVVKALRDLLAVIPTVREDLCGSWEVIDARKALREYEQAGHPEHRTSITVREDHGIGPRYIGLCTCGWTGQRMLSELSARANASDHVVAANG